MSTDPKLLNNQLIAFYLDLFLAFEKDEILKKRQQNPNFTPKFDLDKFKKVCQITFEGFDPYQNLDPMKHIQDATFVYEMEKIFENKLNEFFSKNNDLNKMNP